MATYNVYTYNFISTRNNSESSQISRVDYNGNLPKKIPNALDGFSDPNQKLDGFYSKYPSNYISIDELKDVLYACRDVSLITSTSQTTFLYDVQEKILHPTIYSGTLTPLFLKPITIDIFTDISICSKCIIVVKTKVNYEKYQPIKVDKIINYPLMITDLEKLGLVEIKTTSSIMAFDDRKFRLVGNLSNTNQGLGNDVFYDVDCLGTKLCSEISQKVQDVWSLATI